MVNKTSVLINTVSSIMKSEEFKENFRMTNKDFSRNRKLGFLDYISFIMQCNKSSIQSGLNMFINKNHNKCQEYSKQAFSKGRRRIKSEAFKHLMEEAAKAFYKDEDILKLDEYLLLSIDGSDYNLPNSPELLKVFGSEPFNNGLQVQAQTSTLYDVLNGIVIEAEIEPYNTNERKLAATHIERFRNNYNQKAIVMMDRGYPSFELINICEKYDMKYLMRCNKNNFLAEIRDTKTNDEIVTVKRSNKELTVRVITIDVNNTTITLITNLFEKYSSVDLAELYAKRWNIEILYNKLKNTLEIENFSGLDELCVKQDFYASMLLLNMTAATVYDSQKKLNNTIRKHASEKSYKINHTYAVSELKMRLIKMVYTDSALVRLRESNYIKKSLLKNSIMIQSDRSNPRKIAHPCLKYPTNHKKTII